MRAGWIMWTGRCYRLKKDLHAVEKMGDQQIPGFIPSAEVVEVARGPYDSFIQIVELRWLGRNFIAFAVDLQACGKEVIQQHTVGVGG